MPLQGRWAAAWSALEAGGLRGAGWSPEVLCRCVRAPTVLLFGKHWRVYVFKREAGPALTYMRLRLASSLHAIPHHSDVPQHLPQRRTPRAVHVRERPVRAKVVAPLQLQDLDARAAAVRAQPA